MIEGLRVFGEVGKICRIVLAAFDPAEDADGSQAEKLVDLVVEALYG